MFRREGRRTFDVSVTGKAKGAVAEDVHLAALLPFPMANVRAGEGVSEGEQVLAAEVAASGFRSGGRLGDAELPRAVVAPVMVLLGLAAGHAGAVWASRGDASADLTARRRDVAEQARVHSAAVMDFRAGGAAKGGRGVESGREVVGRYAPGTELRGAGCAVHLHIAGAEEVGHEWPIA